MLSGQPAAGDSRSKQSLTPLILFAASPGTITGVITLSVAHTRMTLPLTSLIAIAVATGITWLAMLLVAHFGGKQESGGFLRDTLTRFMGLIVLSMGVQFALTGYRSPTRPTVTGVELSFIVGSLLANLLHRLRHVGLSDFVDVTRRLSSFRAGR